MTAPALSVRDLRVELVSGLPVVDGLTLSVAQGQIVGLVGESGSGKTTAALALLGYARPGMRIAGGTVEIAGRRIDGSDERTARRLRGSVVSYVPQDPGNALNPALRIRAAIEDMLTEHEDRRPGNATVEGVLENVHLPSARAFSSRFPHQLSGGQQQRVTIALALVCEPPVVVLDEPTTGLDVITQARVLDEIERLRRERRLAMVYISHDLAVVSQVADWVAVLYAGRIVEEGATDAVLTRPRHPYTRGLVASIPDHRQPRRLRSMPGVAVGVDERPHGCAFAPRCPQRVERCVSELPALEPIEPGLSVRCFEWRSTPPLEHEPPHSPSGRSVSEAPLLLVETLQAGYQGRHERTIAASRVSFSVEQGACVALVGESGSGKTTIARCVVGLHEPDSGRILLDGMPLAGRAGRRTREERRRIQIVFQNPYESLNPRQRVAEEIARPARVLRALSRTDADVEVERLLERVRLPTRLGRRFPSELSGGERQRVAIARALAARPDLIVCDEVTSALDVSVQAAVLELLAELREELGLALLFITHDLGVVASVADRVLVLDRGQVCEEGTIEQVLSAPQHEYTRRLLEAAPALPATV
ncbi:MAG: ABC transporter ATP-binding protein [Gaiellaceae bacterium]